MQVFKCALRVMRGNITFLIVYIIGLSFMGVFMAQSFHFESAEHALEQISSEFTIVDRDHSALSQGIAEMLEQRGVPIEVEDSRMAFQDAVAKGQTDYLLVVPAGYETAFREAALAGEEAPQMDVVYSFYAADGALMDEAVDAYLTNARTLILADPSASMSNVVSQLSSAMEERADVKLIKTNEGMTEADRFVFYLQWSTYTLFAGIVVCIGLLISTMNRADVRRRNLASPMGYASYNVQLAVSCAVIALAACAWTFGLGLVAFPAAVAAMGIAGLAWSGLSVLVYSFMALAFGFMLGQFGASTLLCNAFGNIFGMVISFLGGAWISLDIMSPEVVSVAHWLPGYWYTDACQLATHMTETNVMPLLIDLGVLVLFALAFFSIGLVAAKKRMQTSEAGGNRAAQTAPVYS